MANISNIRVWPLKKPHAKIAANGDFIVDGGFKVKFTLFKSAKGMFVGLPGRYGDTPGEDGKKPWYADVSFVDDNVRNELTERVVAEYNKATGGETMNQGEAPGPTNQSNIPF